MTISVIIPTARDSAALAPLLESLRGQVLDVPWEVIAVNDRPQTRREDPSFCRVLSGEGKGPARARNLGAAHARGTFLLFLDDDVEVDRFYLGRILKQIEARPNYAVFGMQVATDRENLFSLASERMLQAFVEEEGSRFAPSNAFAVRRADFERCGGFDPSFPLAAGEDREFCLRWIASGFKIAAVKDATVAHRFPESFASLAWQQWRYGRGAFHLRDRVDASQGPRIRAPRYYFRMLAGPLRQYGLWRGSIVGMLCGISQAILACGYLRERIRPAARTGPEEPSFKEARAE